MPRGASSTAWFEERFILRRAVYYQFLALHAEVRAVLAVGAALPKSKKLLEPCRARGATRHVGPERALPPGARRTQRFGAAQRVYDLCADGAGHVPGAFQWCGALGSGVAAKSAQI